MNLPKRSKRGLEYCWKDKKFQGRRICINMSAGKKRECKSPLFYFFKKNIKFLILWIDNISAIVYYLIKIRDKEKPKMTKTYKIAEEIAHEIVNVHNEKYEALKIRDTDSYIKLDTFESNLKDALESFGYEISWIYDKRAKAILFNYSNMVFKVAGAGIRRVKEEN